MPIEGSKAYITKLVNSEFLCESFDRATQKFQYYFECCCRSATLLNKTRPDSDIAVPLSLIVMIQTF